MLDRNKSLIFPTDVWRLILDELGVNNLWSLILTAKFFDLLIEEWHGKKLIKLFNDNPVIVTAIREKKFHRLRHLYVTLMNLIADTAIPQSLLRFLEVINTANARLAALYCIDDNLEEFQKLIGHLRQPTSYLLLAVACRSHKIVKQYLSQYKYEIELCEERPKKFLDMAYYSGDLQLVNLTYDVLGNHLQNTINLHTLKYAVFSGNTRLAQVVKTHLDKPHRLICGISVTKTNDIQKDIVLSTLLNDYAIRSKNPLMVDLVLTWVEEYKETHPGTSIQLHAAALNLAEGIGKPDMVAKVKSLLTVPSHDPLAIWRSHLAKLKELAHPFKGTYKSFLRLLRYILEDAAIKNIEHKKALLLSVLLVADSTIQVEGKHSEVLFNRYTPIKQVIQKILLASNSGVKFDVEQTAFCLKQLPHYVLAIQDSVWKERIGETKEILLITIRNMLANLHSIAILKSHPSR